MKQETLKEEIDNILSTTPFYTIKEVKDDFIYRITKFYGYNIEATRDDYLISKSNGYYKLNLIEFEARIKESITNKIKNELTLYRNYAISNSLNKTSDDIKKNIQNVLITQGFQIKESNGSIIYSKESYSEHLSGVEFEQLIEKIKNTIEKENKAENRFRTKIETALLLTRGKTPQEIKSVFLQRMKNDHSYECKITDKGNYLFIPDYNSFCETKSSYEVSGKELNEKIELILNSREKKDLKQTKNIPIHKTGEMNL